MAKNYVSEGNTLDLTSELQTQSGKIYEDSTSKIVGVSLNDAEIGDEVRVKVTGVFDLEKDNPADTYSIGQLVYNNGGLASTSVATAVGICIQASAGGETTVRARLQPVLL